MGAVILRAQTCITCGGPLPSAARVDRRYCKGACRTLAYRVRRRVNATRPPGPLEPEWTEPNAVVKTMLTSLAQIQARVLDFAHQMEQEELYARLPVRTKQQRPDTADSPPSDQTRENAAHRGGVADADGSSTLSEKLDEVQRQRDQFRTDLLTEQARTQQLDFQLKTLQKQANEANTGPVATMNGTNLAARLDEVRRQRDQLEADLLAERERTGRLDAHLKTIQKESKEAMGRLSYKQATLQQERDNLASQVSDLGTQLYRAKDAIATWEQVGAASLKAANKISALQQENAALRAEVKRLRPPSADADPLVCVMIDRVKALHSLAVYQIQRGVKITGQLLPSYDNELILVAAQGHAFAARRDHYLTNWGPYLPKPVWVKEDYLLDAESEKKVCDDASFKNRRIISELESERWLVDQKG